MEDEILPVEDITTFENRIYEEKPVNPVHVPLMIESIDNKWHGQEIDYLRKMSRNCEILSNRYRVLYNIFRKQQIRYKLPAIVLGSVLGLTSFGSNQFGPQTQWRLSIFVGSTSLLISIISSIEAFLKLGENMSNSLVATQSYMKLKEKIDMELALPVQVRTSSGIIFLKECYSEYIKILDLAPPLLKKNSYIYETITERFSKLKSVYHKFSQQRFSLSDNTSDSVV